MWRNFAAHVHHSECEDAELTVIDEDLYLLEVRESLEEMLVSPFLMASIADLENLRRLLIASVDSITCGLVGFEVLSPKFRLNEEYSVFKSFVGSFVRCALKRGVRDLRLLQDRALSDSVMSLCELPYGNIVSVAGDICVWVNMMVDCVHKDEKEQGLKTEP
ncbi:hypothetical protein TNCV_1402991 [Trichonephila clavipes]|nr:hypothetical protein TNCV_1402991 [Trichonephila clavipes]